MIDMLDKVYILAPSIPRKEWWRVTAKQEPECSRFEVELIFSFGCFRCHEEDEEDACDHA